MSIIPFRKRKSRRPDAVDEITARLAFRSAFLRPPSSLIFPPWLYLVQGIMLFTLSFFSTNTFEIVATFTLGTLCFVCYFWPSVAALRPEHRPEMLVRVAEWIRGRFQGSARKAGNSEQADGTE